MAGRERILAIEPTTSDPNRCRVRVGADKDEASGSKPSRPRTVAVLSRFAIEDMGLREGEVWTADLADRVTRRREFDRAERAALSLLGRRSRLRSDVVQRLTQRGYDPQIAEQVAETLTERGWLDDAAYARELAESILRRSQPSRAMLIEKLTAKSIERDLAESLANELFTAGQEVEQCCDTLNRSLPDDRARADIKRIRRAVAGLQRRGFDEETIAAAMQRLSLTDVMEESTDNE